LFTRSLTFCATLDEGGLQENCSMHLDVLAGETVGLIARHPIAAAAMALAAAMLSWVATRGRA
jgi:hypothetical protein